MRLQKFLAEQGHGSRRQVEQWIKDGRLQQNFKICSLGDSYQEGSELRLDNKVLRLKPVNPAYHRLLMYYKPEGQLCSRKNELARETVFESLPKLGSGRWIAVGRLDLNSSGLLLFTTDGELANALMHPRANIERQYLVRVLGTVTDTMIAKMQRGIRMDDGTMLRVKSVTALKPASSKQQSVNNWYKVVLTEGKYREIRRLFAAVGLKVSRLLRTKFGPFRLPKQLAARQYFELDYAKYKAMFE